jgi:glycerophosphoryl diester phosphodiesterase
LVKSIQAAGRAETVLVSSFHPGFLRRIARTPRPPSLALLTEGDGNDQTLALCRELELFAWHPNWRRLSRARVGQFRAAGLRVFAYTVNHRRAFERLIAMGANGAFTDDPMALT